MQVKIEQSTRVYRYYRKSLSDTLAISLPLIVNNVEKTSFFFFLSFCFQFNVVVSMGNHQTLLRDFNLNEVLLAARAHILHR